MDNILSYTIWEMNLQLIYRINANIDFLRTIQDKNNLEQVQKEIDKLENIVTLLNTY